MGLIFIQKMQTKKYFQINSRDRWIMLFPSVVWWWAAPKRRLNSPKGRNLTYVVEGSQAS